VLLVSKNYVNLFIKKVYRDTSSERKMTPLLIVKETPSVFETKKYF